MRAILALMLIHLLASTLGCRIQAGPILSLDLCETSTEEPILIGPVASSLRPGFWWATRSNLSLHSPHSRVAVWTSNPTNSGQYVVCFWG